MRSKKPNKKPAYKSTEARVKKSKNRIAPIEKSTSLQQSRPDYIDVNEHSAELSSKSRLLWIIVGVFAVCLISVWLIILRFSIQKETAKMGFNQIGDEIAKSLDRFDTEIKNRTAVKPIDTTEIDAIKKNLEEQIKRNPDSSSWPTHAFDLLKLTIQYPDTWKKLENKESIIVGDYLLESGVPKEYGRIAISAISNPRKYNLDIWAQKNNSMFDGYVADKPLFVFSTTSPDTIAYLKSSSTDQLDKIILLNSPTDKLIYEIKLEAVGDISYYQPIMEAIIKTIKM